MSYRICGCHRLDVLAIDHLDRNTEHLERGAISDARPFALPGDAPHWGRAMPFAIEAIEVRVRLDLDARAVEGEATLEVRRIDPDATELALDAVDFELREVASRSPDGFAPVAHRYDGHEIRIDASLLGAARPGERATVRVRYRCVPRRGLYFVSRRPLRAAPDARAPIDEVWSQGQDQDNRHWFPCADHPNQRMRTEVIAEVPRGFFALSNGELVDRTAAGETETFHWRQREPHPAYLVTLACARVEEAHERAGQIPVDYYVPVGAGEHIGRSLGRTPKMLELFQQKIGVPYPWAKYAQIVVSDFIFGGMENTSATTLFDRVLLDERAAIDVDMDSLVAHELAHQWFGDLVTCRDWSHAWLNEGFATYLEHVWREHAEGPDAYLYGLEQDLDIYLDEDRDRYRRPIVTNVFAAPIDVFDRHLYQKGALTLHALRMHLGDGPFWAGIKEYVSRMRGRGAETRDLMRSIEEATGRSLEAFFEQWVMKAGHPALEVSSEHEAGVLRITVTQTQARPGDSHGLFTFELPIEVVNEAGPQRHRLPISKQRETFALRCASAPKMVLIDPQMHVHGTVDTKLGTALLIEQLARAGYAQPRWRAARALGKRNEPRAIAALGRALVSDAFWAVRAEAATALGEQRAADALAALVGGIGDVDARVRRAVASALGKYRVIKEGDLGARAADALLDWMRVGDRSYLVESELRRALGKTRDPRAIDELLARAKSDPESWADVVRQGAIDGLAATRMPHAIDALIEAAGDAQAPSVRRAALTALGRAREIVDDEARLVRVRGVIERATEAFDVGVRSAAARALAALRDPAGAGALSRLADRDLDGRVRRAAREALRDLRDRTARNREVSVLRDELEKVRAEMREMRAQMAALEARTKA